MGSVWVLQLSPGAQKHAVSGVSSTGHSKFPIGVTVTVNGNTGLSALTLSQIADLSRVYPDSRPMVDGIGCKRLLPVTPIKRNRRKWDSHNLLKHFLEINP